MEIDIKDLRNLIGHIKTLYNYDFSDYAMSSFKRRIERILSTYKLASVDQLILKLKADAKFSEEVVREITVNTTEMFRDPSFWKKLRDDVIPVLAKNSKIRIWHAACSSGEEVYSMAILLKELDLLDKALIYATDINDEVIKTAQAGIYPKRNHELNQSNYARFGGQFQLDKYYTLNDAVNTQFDKSLLNNVTFKKHDLVLGAVFSKFDLIICRNVLIYFNFNLQDKVVQTFSESLYAGSYLAIGVKESISWCKSAKAFNAFNVEEKIYKKNN